MTTLETAAAHLSERQLARVAALYVAGEVVSGKSMLTRSAVGADELIEVAEYVVNGRPGTSEDALTTYHADTSADPLADVRSWATSTPPPEGGEPDTWAHGYKWAQIHVSEMLS